MYKYYIVKDNEVSLYNKNLKYINSVEYHDDLEEILIKEKTIKKMEKLLENYNFNRELSYNPDFSKIDNKQKKHDIILTIMLLNYIPLILGINKIADYATINQIMNFPLFYIPSVIEFVSFIAFFSTHFRLISLKLERDLYNSYDQMYNYLNKVLEKEKLKLEELYKKEKTHNKICISEGKLQKIKKDKDLLHELRHKLSICEAYGENKELYENLQKENSLHEYLNSENYDFQDIEFVRELMNEDAYREKNLGLGLKL